MALGVGATLYLAPKEVLLSGVALLQLLRDEAITNVTLPPAVLKVLPSENLPTLRTIISAGEACSGDIVRWAAGRHFFNAYGPTEVTIWATVAQLSDDSAKPPIGRPIANTQIYILDAELEPVPIGVVGELYIGGVGSARGYLNQTDLTAQQFIPHPFSSEPGTRLYKTGDLARYRHDGNISFLGRIDEQVKLRGFRIELGEIETVLTQHPAVQEAVVIVREDVAGDKRLVAYIVPNQEQAITPDDLRCFLQEKLPHYLVPSAFVLLEALPLTPNGKVNRHALPAPSKANPRLPEYVAPRTPTEETLAKIWAQVLNLERVSIYDNFFELGGDSLLSMRLMEQINEQFAQKIPLSNLFLAPTIARLASTLHPESDSLAWSPLVPIQPAGDNPPFFCVHPVLGVVFPYYELAYHLGHDQPFYGLQPLGLDGEQPPYTQIKDMATHYIEALRVVQPEGPYFLGGWSFGGLVAFEMAQQLLSSGHQVALLVLIDTAAPVSSNRPSVCESLKFLFTTAARSIWPYLIDYFYLVPQKSKLLMLNEPTIRSMLRLLPANSQAAFNYVPQPYPNKITVFKTSEPSIAHQDPTLGWNQLAAGGIEIQLVPGNHLTMLRKPHVQVLAEQLRVCIDKARTI